MYNPKTIFLLLVLATVCHQQLQATATNDSLLLLRPTWVFDGMELHEGWAVLVRDDKIIDVGPAQRIQPPPATRILDLPKQTVLPGLIEGHAHLFLYPYNITPWDDQILNESAALRTARAVKHAEATLKAGFTTVRDLGTEGAGYSDVGLKQAIAQGVVQGPNLLISTRAIVATGSYGPKKKGLDYDPPLGAEEADGPNLVRVVREQIGRGADFIKVYADYRWGPNDEAMPTFSLEELKLIVETAKSSGRPTVAHATTSEGMRRAILAGVTTIEHGDGGTPEIWELMKTKGVALCPTLAAGDAVLQYRGWNKQAGGPVPERIKAKQQSFKQALEAGVTMLMGGDVGVFAHGDNVREMELMQAYGMHPLDVLRAATSVNADAFGLRNLGKLAPNFTADLVVVAGNPVQNMGALRQVKTVYKAGKKVE